MTEREGQSGQPRPWSIRLYQPGDEVQIVGLFQRVFGKERSLAHWRWKFMDNPEGAQICLAVTDTGEVIGQYAGIPVRVMVDGQILTFSQSIDSMVDAGYRRGLKKPGVFASLFERFADTYGGRDGVTILWGYTTPEALRIGRRLLGYLALHRVVKLVRSVDSPARLSPWQQMSEAWRRIQCPIHPVRRFDAGIDRLWEQCRPELRVATIRDARYLNWRYADCPDVQYRLLMAGGTMGTPPLGMAVLRLGWEGQPVACLVDWLVPWKNMAAAERLLQRSFEEAGLAGMKELHAWFPPSSPWCRYLRDKGFQSIETACMTVRQFTPTISLELLNAHWYYTMGDSDHY
ncbi:hypothetical protein MELA_02087 [Candidatus Methylomirabilis lanthanidiphila]|uniref:Uncharacterized protein n=1 Tax=Candidatus Methylomirabilis lanthanidiphila TaxID=2211376 RepID=A0A564ZM18_9BACT|nr:GNAT family N-acetyltransferase [Candidatus Methylomirabilis lanthanidiphila]VUZ85702.1 hypothetical protein MELA_02087 [Candidatus Methylomirabilis lanthanidiphila]